MIKNLLYSLFLHFILLLIIYTNFNLKKINEDKTTEIAVSLIALNGDENASNIKPVGKNDEEEKETKTETTKEEIKKPQSQKKSKQDKVREKQQKETLSKPAKSIKKSLSQEKIQEFQRQEKEDQKQEEAPRIKEDKISNENQDSKNNDTPNQNQEIGAKQKSSEEQEENSKKNITQNETIDLANSLENMDLSAREKFNIHLQLKRCFRRAIDETKLSSKMKVIIKVIISQDGYIGSDIDELIDVKRYNNPQEINYKIAIDNVKRALNLCSPLRNLPLDKYDVWREAILEFDEEEEKK
ncbi:MAG: hypothetical protein A2887_03895 [Alphaproteobacteria bacterium RIFCSPLOWO2_01_FULL_40_26]|nr:MAG: hypothetical protein A3D15_05050 [Alphaproteobacteria bacterium RIFCSPHIGHO2_02_FULL_40_34]OFW87989.1 MAG: hypothetical protein A2794_00795 [Alphaproteobacteria bacterium RIFCSPHIGHO2_01_FULL_40_8]OFW95340.1 MAG: hypothetical protein A2887_03895 [Alphaproteobacteria bacterium RIFCSPLOWO2_01_FULL_40_26]OFX09243.1 MAG: hypothetical protein A3H30_06600 [Alphaproteobacteria bacterium RIFCSPLOWO2_02_FULL_40_19]OFX11599.1 MAG: hypothetical protein A3G22_05210 [Alphaproteobacteria bacterium RI